MTDTELVLKAYEIIGNLTPLHSDCGRLCNAACCQGDDDEGMLLFPGEKELFTDNDSFSVKKTNYKMSVVVCKGQCNRKSRPLSCRIFPLAIVCKNGITKVIADPRSRFICPLYSKARIGRLDPEFVSAVKQAARLLSGSKTMTDFFASTYEQCSESEALPF